MSTPVTLKKMEEAKEKAQQRKFNNVENKTAPLSSLTDYSNKKNFTNYRNHKPIDFTVDRFDGRQYKSFEQSGQNLDERKRSNTYRRNNTPRFIKLIDYEVLDLPADLATDDYIVDSNNVVSFNGKEHFLSGFFPSTIKIEEHEYKSVEHYYQACKLYSLAGSDHALQLRNIDEPTKVKVTAKKILLSLKVPRKDIEMWKATHGFIMLQHAMIHKYVQNLDLQEKLVATGDAILSHCYDRDSFYACGLKKDDFLKWAQDNEGKVIKIPSELTYENVKYIQLIGKGKNIVGAMAMSIRKQIIALKRENEEITVEPFLPSILNSLNLTNGGGRESGIVNNHSGDSTATESILIEKMTNL